MASETETPPTSNVTDTPATDLVEQLHSDLDREEKEFRSKYPLAWGFSLFGPPLLTAGILTYLWIARGFAFVSQLVGTAVPTFFFFGRFAILLGQEGSGEEAIGWLTRWEIFWMVIFMDLMCALFLACNTRLLFGLPLIGGKFRTLVEDGQFILHKNPWMEKVTFLGIIAFVVFPLASTGSIGGAIFGRLLGLSRLKTFLGVVIGSFSGCGIMFALSGLLNVEQVKDNIWLKVGGIAVIVGLVLLLNHRYQKMKSRHMAEKSAREESASTRASTNASQGGA